MRTSIILETELPTVPSLGAIHDIVALDLLTMMTTSAHEIFEAMREAVHVKSNIEGPASDPGVLLNL